MAVRNEQLHFDLGGAPSLTRDDLVVSPSNAAAVALIDNWPEWHAPYALLVGPEGCGKTHLSEIWIEKSGAFSAKQNDLKSVLQPAQNGIPILIDAMSEGAFDEADLFHLMNAVKGAQSHLLLTATTSPKHWEIKTPDLLSRLKSATAVKIDPPDDPLIAAVIVKLFSDRQIAIDPAVVDFLLLRVERSLASINEIVAQIDRAALANKSRITRQFVGQVLKSMDASEPQLDF